MSLKKQGKYRFQDFEVDLAPRTLLRDGHTVTVSSRTFDLLTFLILNPQRIVTKDEVMRALWPGAEVEESNLSQHIFLLRKALTGSQSGDRLILTIPGRGYQFTVPVSLVPESATANLPETAGEQSRGRDSETKNQQPPQHEMKHRFPEQSDAGRVPRQLPRTPTEPILEALTAQRVKKDQPGKENQQAKRNRQNKPSRSHGNGDASSEVDSEEISLNQHPVVVFFQGFRHPDSWHFLTLTLVLALLGFGSLFLWRLKHRPIPQSLGLVIADFENKTGDMAFDQALGAAVAIDLHQSPFLQVASNELVEEKLIQMKDNPNDPVTATVAQEVCIRLKDQVYLTGEVHRLAQKYLVTLQAFDCSNSKRVANSRGIADTPDGVVKVLDKVGIDLRKQLGEPADLTSRYNKPLFSGRAASLEALRAYADAVHLQNQGKLNESIALFKRAVELDPQFALAFIDLGAAYSVLGEKDLADASVTSAYQLRDSVDELDRLFIVATYNQLLTGDLLASIRNDKQWREEYPRDTVPLNDLADIEIQIGRPALALEATHRALDLNPAEGNGYIHQARAQMHLGQFDAAAATCQDAIAHLADSPEIHALLFQIAFAQVDQSAMDEQTTWARSQGTDKPAQAYMESQIGLMDFAQGKIKAAQAVFAHLADEFRKQGQQERANRLLGEMPRMEAELGMVESAHALLDRLPEINGSADIPVAWAHVGEAKKAENLLLRELNRYPYATLWQEDLGPQVRAAIALNRHQPEVAIKDLQPAEQFDLRSFDGPALRGRAYIVTKQSSLAETEFHKILDHPGIEPLSYNYPLAQLGVARALAQEGKIADAMNAYKVVFAIWKDADPELPRLKEAKAEYAHLNGGPVKSSSLTSKRPTDIKR
jgi:DNA-binding winged helix-turn-helix (wHTH) protein/tetratricopeptide (TPR) repeat protein